MAFHAVQLRKVTVKASEDRREQAPSSGHSNTEVREMRKHQERSLRRTVSP